MDSNPDTLLHVLINTRVGTRFSKLGFACVCFFEFANGMGIYALNNAVTVSGECFGLSVYQMRILFIVHFANSYISPLLAALYADLKVGTYRAIFFTAAMRIFAAMILLIIVIIFSVSDKDLMNPTLKSALFGIYVFGLMFLFVSIEFFSSLLIPFGIQQVNQESRMAIASAARWLLWSYDVGVVVATLGVGYLRNLYWENHILVETLAGFITSSLMISVFILGKSQYNRTTPTEGRASIATIFSIIKARFCYRPSYQSLTEPQLNFGPDNGEQHVVHQRIKIERLIVRKVLLMVVFFACIGVGEVIYFKMIFIKASGGPKDFGHETFMSGYQILAVYIPTIVLIPFCDCVARRERVSDSPLVGDRKVIHFRTMGAGLSTAALAALAAALLCHFKQLLPDINDSFWQIPIFLILGMLTPLTYIKALEFCYTECLKGLECVTTSLLASLWMLLYSIIRWTEVEWNQDLGHLESLFISLSGAMVATILVVFIPVSVFYNRVKSEIDEATASFSNRDYNTLRGSTLLTNRFLANEETGERVHIAQSEDESDDSESLGRCSKDSESDLHGSDSDVQ